MKKIVISCIVLFLTGLLFLSCDEPKVGLIIENNAEEAYRFTGKYPMVAVSFDTIIQPGEKYHYDNTNKNGQISFYGDLTVKVYNIGDNLIELKSIVIFIPKASDKESVNLSWDGTSFKKQ
jgi:hypothetical protein